jgi:hypothetical protein
VTLHVQAADDVQRQHRRGGINFLLLANRRVQHVHTLHGDVAAISGNELNPSLGVALMTPANEIDSDRRCGDQDTKGDENPKGT